MWIKLDAVPTEAGAADDAVEGREGAEFVDHARRVSLVVLPFKSFHAGADFVDQVWSGPTGVPILVKCYLARRSRRLSQHAGLLSRGLLFLKLNEAE